MDADIIFIIKDEVGKDRKVSNSKREGRKGVMPGNEITGIVLSVLLQMETVS